MLASFTHRLFQNRSSSPDFPQTLTLRRRQNILRSLTYCCSFCWLSAILTTRVQTDMSMEKERWINLHRRSASSARAGAKWYIHGDIRKCIAWTTRAKWNRAQRAGGGFHEYVPLSRYNSVGYVCMLVGKRRRAALLHKHGLAFISRIL